VGEFLSTAKVSAASKKGPDIFNKQGFKHSNVLKDAHDNDHSDELWPNRQMAISKMHRYTFVYLKNVDLVKPHILRSHSIQIFSK